MMRRWLLADQLGPHFRHDAPDGRSAMVESRRAFTRRPMHRAKAHLLLSAMRHAAAEHGPGMEYVQADTMREGVELLGGELEAISPTSWGMRHLMSHAGVSLLPARGFIVSESDFATWADGRRRLVLEDFYRWSRRRSDVLMDGAEPVDGRWNFDADNRLPPPRGAATLGLAEPAWPTEDAIDAEVRDQLDRWEREGATFVGDDGPRRFAATRAEAVVVLRDFVDHRLADFGPYEDAALTSDWVMAHSLISAPMNLGLLDPMEVIDAVVDAHARGAAPLSSVEGFVRQVLGWRDFVWHLYWHFGPDYIAQSNALGAHADVPTWFMSLDAGASVKARCLSQGLADVRRYGWTHHIVRLMVLGNWALQRGFDPVQTTRWFTDSFVDGHEWVMAANVVGMSLHADGGRMATKPYAAGGAYIKRMTDFCRGCAYRPDQRVGERACPVTAGYWEFLDRHEERFARHPRMAQAVRGLGRLADRAETVAGVRDHGNSAP